MLYIKYFIFGVKFFIQFLVRWFCVFRFVSVCYKFFVLYWIVYEWVFDVCGGWFFVWIEVGGVDVFDQIFFQDFFDVRGVVDGENFLVGFQGVVGGVEDDVFVWVGGELGGDVVDFVVEGYLWFGGGGIVRLVDFGEVVEWEGGGGGRVEGGGFGFGQEREGEEEGGGQEEVGEVGGFGGWFWVMGWVGGVQWLREKLEVDWGGVLGLVMVEEGGDGYLGDVCCYGWWRLCVCRFGKFCVNVRKEFR